MASEYNFFQSSRESDRNLFFGPLTGESFFPVPETMAHVMVLADIFPSVSLARKNGYHKPVPFGFTDMHAGKNKTRITIFKERI